MSGNMERPIIAYCEKFLCYKSPDCTILDQHCRFRNRILVPHRNLVIGPFVSFLLHLLAFGQFRCLHHLEHPFKINLTNLFSVHFL